MRYLPLIYLLCIMLAGCATEPRVITRTVTVEIPVYQPRTPPAWLMAPVLDADAIGDVFVSPDDPGIVLGVTREGLKNFWQLIDRPVGRIEAWQAWAVAPAEGLEIERP